jgi:hypothetical protein
MLTSSDILENEFSQKIGLWLDVQDFSALCYIFFEHVWHSPFNIAP